MPGFSEFAELRRILPAIAILISHTCVMAAAWSQQADTSLTSAIDANFRARSRLFAEIPVVDDAVFARRLALDLTGMPLSIERLQAFLADTGPDKRARLADELLATPQSARHLATWLSMILLERRGAKVANDDLWTGYLMDLVRQDKPLTDLTTELLTATGEEGPAQVTARFLMDREGEPNLLTRDVGRVFLGRDMQCNQCHDHPLVDGYLQNDYQSLLAFLQPTSIVTVKQAGKDKSLLTERAGGRVLFDSVFVKDDSQLTGPGLPGQAPATDPAVKPGHEYLQRQSPSTVARPQASRRAILAQQIIDSPIFAQNWANRIWSIAFGRGVIHPPDFTHPENPPVDSDLLKSLTEAFKSSGYRIRPVLRAIVLSRPYQSPFDLIGPLAQPTKPGDLAEMKSTLDRYDSELKTLEDNFKKTRAEWNKAQAAAVPAQKARDALQAKLDEFGGKRDLAMVRLDEISTRLTQMGPQRQALADARTALEKAVASLTGDKELETAAKTLADKLAKVEAERVSLTEEQGKKAVERRTAEEQLGSVQFQARTAENVLEPLMSSVLRLEEPFRLARRALDEKIQAITQLKNELYWRETCNSYIKAEIELRDISFQVAQLEPMATSVRMKLENARNIQKELTERVAKQTTNLKQARDAMAVNQQATDQAGLAAKALEKSQADLREAIRLVPDLTELGQVQSIIEKNLGQVTGKAGQARDAVAKQAAIVAELENSLSSSGREVAEQRKKSELLATESAMLDGQLAALVKMRQGLDGQLATLTETVARLASERFELAGLKPLGPESLAWSIMKTTRVYDNYWKTESAALEKSKPATEAQKKDRAWLAAREAEIESGVYAKLKSYPTQFARLYGLGEGQPQSDFFASADQALYMANGGSVASWCMPSAGNPADLMIKAKSPAEAADALYMGVLGRRPDADESRLVAEALAKADAKTRATVARDLVWGLLASPEFRFNH